MLGGDKWRGKSTHTNWLWRGGGNRGIVAAEMGPDKILIETIGHLLSRALDALKEATERSSEGGDDTNNHWRGICTSGP